MLRGVSTWSTATPFRGRGRPTRPRPPPPDARNCRSRHPQTRRKCGRRTRETARDVLRRLASAGVEAGGKNFGPRRHMQNVEGLELPRRLAQNAPRQVHQRVAPGAQHVAHTRGHPVAQPMGRPVQREVAPRCPRREERGSDVEHLAPRGFGPRDDPPDPVQVRTARDSASIRLSLPTPEGPTTPMRRPLLMPRPPARNG
jgi:hypothetical protein